MSLLKLPLLLLSAISYDVGLGHPNPLESEDRVVVGPTHERMWRHAGLPCNLFLKGTIYLTAVAESMVILGSLYDARQSSDTISAVLDVLGPVEASQLTIPFILGVSLVISGGIIRAQCYRTLGPFFTFVQCIRKDHKLVTTGPYSVVRHPGYGSLQMCLVGSCIMLGSPGSWLRASGMLGVPLVRAAIMVSGLITAVSFPTMFRRTTGEDQLLSERFGKEWENWARRVKYKLVPFVY